MPCYIILEKNFKIGLAESLIVICAQNSEKRVNTLENVLLPQLYRKTSAKSSSISSFGSTMKKGEQW